ncbi:hypothetical protein M9458_007522 [Cirrhinus mrigala]|uniref:AIG1-type G domain-containing protein n=1 Tax=Cirrhinus mrigala TaxID=683832 RepID=A0ABD0RKC2_CIRMR
MCSVTTVCQKKVCEVDGRSIAVVDTPGLFDTTLSNDQVVEEIMKCVSLLSPGPHVFVIVLSVGRFTKEESDTVDLIKKIFGPNAAHFSNVLFTRGDDLGNKSIEKYVERGNNAEVKKLISDCGNRFLPFINKENQDRNQVIQLLKMIEEVKNTKEGQYFTNSMFEEAEMSIKKRMKEILKEKEREIHTQNEALKAKDEMEIKNLKKRLKEEKQRADKVKEKMENQIRIERSEKEQDREMAERLKQDLQREKIERDIMKAKHEEDIKEMVKKHEDEARRKAEEINDFRDRKKKWNLHINKKLEEPDESMEDHEDQQKGEKEELIKGNKRKNKNCVIF